MTISPNYPPNHIDPEMKLDRDQKSVDFEVLLYYRTLGSVSLYHGGPYQGYNRAIFR